MNQLFDVGFIATEPESLAEFLGGEASGLRGRIVIGEFSEEFVALLDVWHGEDYQRHWAEAAARIAAGADRTAFFSSAFEFRWTMWRLGSELRVQEHYLGAEGFPGNSIPPIPTAASATTRTSVTAAVFPSGSCPSKPWPNSLGVLRTD